MTSSKQFYLIWIISHRAVLAVENILQLCPGGGANSQSHPTAEQASSPTTLRNLAKMLNSHKTPRGYRLPGQGAPPAVPPKCWALPLAPHNQGPCALTLRSLGAQPMVLPRHRVQPTSPLSSQIQHWALPKCWRVLGLARAGNPARDPAQWWNIYRLRSHLAETPGQWPCPTEEQSLSMMDINENQQGRVEFEQQ